MDSRHIAAGTKLYVGAPVSPMPPERSAAIAALVARVSGIFEAHLPQCFIEGDKEARQVLVVVASARSDIPRIAGDLNAGLVSVIPDGQFLDILPFVQGTVPAGVREARCQIYPAISKPWLKLW